MNGKESQPLVVSTARNEVNGRSNQATGGAAEELEDLVDHPELLVEHAA